MAVDACWRLTRELDLRLCRQLCLDALMAMGMRG